MRLQLTALLSVAVTASASAPVQADESPWSLSLDTLVYSDTDNVVVVSPQVSVRRELDANGGEVGARVVVDAISAASVDVVSQATPSFFEVRREVNLAVSKWFNGTLPSVSYRFSLEPDYTSHGVHAGVQRRVGSPDTTVSAGYGLTFDAIGRHGTDRELFSESMSSQAADLGVTQNISKRAVVRAVYTLTVQSGYLEKPYRTVPLFDQAGLDAAASSGVELGLDNFDDYRLAGKPPEEVPNRRVRHALAVRGLRYLPSWRAALRVDYQLYADSWGVLAHMLEPSITKSWTPWSWTLRANAFARIYQQSAASFWERTYQVSSAAAIPRWRTMDRSLSPYDSATGGLRFEYTIGSWSGYAEGAAMYTRFNDYLLLDDRLALVGQLGLRWIP